jgi:hypothetical protein
MADKIKIQNIDTGNNEMKFDSQEMLNQVYINDLRDILQTKTSIPTYEPKKFLDCFCLYWDESTTYRLYIWINNQWKYVTLT